jgi:hypothetical protein
MLPSIRGYSLHEIDGGDAMMMTDASQPFSEGELKLLLDLVLMSED